MGTISLILIAVAVSVDGFWGGFAFGLRKIRIPLPSLIVISTWSIVCSMLTMLLGHSLINYISFTTAKWIGALLLFTIGIMALREGLKQKKELADHEQKVPGYNLKDLIRVIDNPLLADVDQQNDVKLSEGSLLGLAVAMDASIAAFTVALAGFNPFTTPFLFGLTHFLLIGLGNFVALRRIFNYIGERFAMVPGTILILLGLARLF